MSYVRADGVFSDSHSARDQLRRHALYDSLNGRRAMDTKQQTKLCRYRGTGMIFTVYIICRSVLFCYGSVLVCRYVCTYAC